MNLRIVPTDTSFCKYREDEKTHRFQKVVQLFNLMRDYVPIRDSKRLEYVKSAFKRRKSTALSKFLIFSNIR